MFRRSIVTEELQDLARRIAENIANNGQTASGRTARSLEVVDENDSLVLYGRKAFGTMETGRKGGRVPRNFSAILYQWSLDKGIAFSDERERRSFAYLLAKKIQKEGTELFREGGRSDVYSNDIQQTVENITQRISKSLQTEIQTIPLNNANNK
jgi:hypothetical protein